MKIDLRLVAMIVCVSGIATAQPIRCDIGGGGNSYCKMGNSPTIDLNIHNPRGKACILLSTKKVTTKKLRQVAWVLSDAGEFALGYKVVPPGIEFNTARGGFMTKLKLQTRSLNPFSADITPIITEPGETDVYAFVAAGPCEGKDLQ